MDHLRRGRICCQKLAACVVFTAVELLLGVVTFTVATDCRSSSLHAHHHRGDFTSRYFNAVAGA